MFDRPQSSKLPREAFPFAGNACPQLGKAQIRDAVVRIRGKRKSTAPGSLFFQIDLIGTFVAREPHRENDGNMPSAASTSAGALSEAQFQCAVIFLRR